MLAIAFAMPLAAQNPAPPQRHAVRGVVFDSVMRAPLAGAVVQVTSRDSVSALFSATTDSAGRFRIDGLPAGRFLIGFYHDALSALGLDAPTRPFDISADSVETVDIGVPSGAVVRALRCRSDSASPHNGMLAGFIRDVGGNAPLAGATVSVEWRAIALDSANYRTVTERAVGRVEGDNYVVCGLPVDAPLTVRVSAKDRHSISGPILVPVTGVARRDFALANTAALRGPASVRGRVVNENGRAVTDGRVAVAALALDAPIRNGSFVLTGLPVGTWGVEARAIGLDPRTVLVDAKEEQSVATTITMADHAQQLDAVTVLGPPSRNAKILDEMLRRQRSSFGTFFLQDSPWLQNALHPADVLRAARGFTYRSPTDIGSRHQSGVTCLGIAVYVNGVRVVDDLVELSNMVPVRDVLAIEAYPDRAFAPFQWRFSTALQTDPKGKLLYTCAIVAVWTTR